MWYIIGGIVLIMIINSIINKIGSDVSHAIKPEEKETDWWTVGAFFDIMNKMNKK